MVSSVQTTTVRRESPSSPFRGSRQQWRDALADDAALRNNRLALLSQLHALMNRVADISKLAA